MDIHSGKLIYHLTHIDNLENILENGLLSRNAVDKLGAFKDIADQDIIKSRNQHNLDDYVPFHFHPYSAFDSAVKYKYGAPNFIYITLLRSVAQKNNFKIVPRHPLNGTFQFYEYDSGFNLIDWKTMNTPMTDFIDDEQKIYAKQIKMAECISPESVLVSDFFQIYCNGSRLTDLQATYSKYADKFSERVWLN